MTARDREIKELLTEFQAEIKNPGDPNKTIVDIIDPAIKAEDVPRTENVWRELFVYFLNPRQEHGLGEEILHTFLNTVENETTIDGVSQPAEDVIVEQEKWTESGDRIDVLLTHDEKWFMCIELKVKAEEHQNQTQRYFKADSIAGRSKSNFSEAGHHYLYLTLEESPVDAHRSFDHITWRKLEGEWRKFLRQKTDDLERYPTLGTAQFAEFLKLISREAQPDHEVGGKYYSNIDSAASKFNKLAYELSQNLTTELERNLPADFTVNESSWGRGRNFPEFSHVEPQQDYNFIDIYRSPLWKVTRANKPAFVVEIHFLLRPHLGPAEYQLQPSVAVHFDIRGGSQLKQDLRSDFESRGLDTELKSEGYGTPHINAKWHYLSKVIRLDETHTPLSDILHEINFLRTYFNEIDEIARFYTG